MTNQRSLTRTAVRSLVIGFVTATALTLTVYFIPLPDALAQILFGAQILGVWIEVERATPYHMSGLNVLLVNAVAYALVTFVVLQLYARYHRRNSDAA